MKRTIMLFLLFLTLGPDARAQTGFDGRRVEREVMSVLDVILDAFNRQDARAEERTYQFPHYRLANGLMSVLFGPGNEPKPGWRARTRLCVNQDGITVPGLDVESSTFRIRRRTLTLRSRGIVKTAPSWPGSIRSTLSPRKMVGGASRCARVSIRSLLRRATKETPGDGDLGIHT
jgi:hypothetical protein